MHIELHTHTYNTHINKFMFVHTMHVILIKKNTKTTKMYTIVDIYIFMYTQHYSPTDYQTPAKNVLNFCALALVWYIPEAWFSICLSIVGSGS